MEPKQKVSFFWSTEYGQCLDCSLPAAFGHVIDGEFTKSCVRYCAICAANHAADGDLPIFRIDSLRGTHLDTFLEKSEWT